MRIAKATPKAVRYACKNFHYAKSVPSAQFAYSVFNDANEWCGVVVFGGGATPMIARPFNLHQGEVLELVRVALNGKQGHGHTSQAVSQALKQLHRDNPLVQLVVSYADCDQHHIGTIYQATNWLYLGKVEQNSLTAFVVNGKRIKRRSIGSMGIKQSLDAVREHLDPNATEFRSLGKRKYVYPFNKRIRKQLAQQAVPYDKA